MGMIPCLALVATWHHRHVDGEELGMVAGLEKRDRILQGVKAHEV